MCGIAGIYHFDRDRDVEGDVLRRMTDTLRHRGPDGEGYYICKNVGLGHRRLSIIDLSSGDQPQYNREGTIAIVFNGEIYNYIELREELVSNGYGFHTNSDTEVIIRAYEHWGVKCQEKFNGMWAFALWDSRRNHLFVSRDRMGEKPLYYAFVDNSIIFGSEIKSILEYGIKFEANLELTELYLSLGYIPAPYSYFKNVLKLRQGHYLIVKDTLTEHQYWDLTPPDESNMLSDRKLIFDKFDSIFSDSVKIRMRSDVPYGAFLSGGLDSASVVARMSSISDIPIRTFTIGFQDKQFDERRLAKEVANEFGTDHSEFVVDTENFEEALEKIVYHYDEPFGDSSAIPTSYVCRIAARKVKMVLTGDGGDEVLSGYNAYQIEKFASLYKRLPAFMKHSFPGMIATFKNVANSEWRLRLNRLERILDYSTQSFESRLRVKVSWYHTDKIGQLTEPLGKQIKVADFISDFYKSYPAKDPFYRLMLFHLKVQLADDFLVKVDRMSMASSIETRVPFLDHRLVEFMTQVSKNVKMIGFERKSVLRNTVGRQLPRSVLRASKKGFSVPVRAWFRDSGFDKQLRLLYEEDFGLNSEIIKKLVSEHKEGKIDSGNFIWMLMVLKRWNDGRAS